MKWDVQKFLDGLWISLSAAVNLFLNDMVTNQRLSFDIDWSPSLSLVEMSYDDLPVEAKKSYEAVKNLSKEDFVYYS